MSESPLSGVNSARALFAVFFAAFAAVSLTTAERGVSPAAAAMVAVGTALFAVTAFDAVRAHALYRSASFAVVTGLAAVWWLGTPADGLLPIVATALLALGTVAALLDYASESEETDS
jgi:hypothetical protein